MYSLIEIVQKAKQYVREAYGRPDREVEEWIASCLGMKRLDLYVQYDRVMEEGELQKIKKGLPFLRHGEPLAYLVKNAPFWKDSFYVTKGVLIPRPETESIVERALHVIQKHDFRSLADVCAGSGCIGLSVKGEIPSLSVLLLDAYDLPLKVSHRNACEKNRDVEIRKGNLMEPLREGEVDIVVANPPYLSLQEWETLDSSVREFEPKEALLGGIKGVELYERLIEQSVEKRVKVLIVEIGERQGEEVSALFRQAGASSVEIFKDLFQRDRGIEAHFSVK